MEVVGELVDFGDDVLEEYSESEDSGEDSELDEEIESDDSFLDNTKVNLDITAMIAYISALTNGGNSFEFSDKTCSQQAELERKNPVKPFLEKIFKDKELICCASAMRDFQTITNIVGGPGERERAGELIKRVTVVPDSDSPRIHGLEVSGKIKDRSRCIFGTGDSMKIVTVTANTGFVRADLDQGVTLAVVTHPYRPLAEDKEILAEKE